MIDKLRVGALAGAILAVLTLAGCGWNPHESADYDRHTMSDVYSSPKDSSILIFAVSLSPKYPDKSPEAEEVRMQWLSAWLRQRYLCPEGFEILSRSYYQPTDMNLYNRDLRYEVTCKVAAPEGTAPETG